MSQSVLETHRTRGVLAQMSPLAQKSQSKKSNDLGFSLNLTTLIDAFCILVIFLLSNMNGQTQAVDVSDQIKLPTAMQNEIIESGLVIKIQSDGIYIDEVKFPLAQVPAHLSSLKSGNVDSKKATLDDGKKYDSLIIQADKNSNFEIIGDVLRAAGQAGFSKYVFAVWPQTK
ncbi:MAG: ExbD/TolR family protein [Pseudobdellovibrionaceae bacterium]